MRVTVRADCVRVVCRRLRVCRINKEHGIRGVYRGHQATLIRIFPYAALNYMGYEQYKRVSSNSSSSSSSRRQQSMPWHGAGGCRSASLRWRVVRRRQ